MTPQEILNDLKSKIPPGTSLKDALTIFILHFDTTDADECRKDDDGDMLLFQWGGPYSWNPYFSINLTRQFSHKDEDGEYEGMEQLSMDCMYDTVDISVESGNQWFKGTNIQAFLKMVIESDAVAAVEGRVIKSIDWNLGEV